LRGAGGPWSNLYTGPNTEDTPVIVEAAAFHDGIVIVQVNQIVDKLPRVDIPASWIDVVVEADKPFAIEPLFTRDPRHIDELQILIGMMVIRGIYETASSSLVESRNRGSIPRPLNFFCRPTGSRLDCAERSASTGRSIRTRP